MAMSEKALFEFASQSTARSSSSSYDLESKDVGNVTLSRSQRNAEFCYLDEEDHVYLDYTGAGLAARTQYEKQSQRLTSTVYGNPHSPSPTSLTSTQQIEETRSRVLQHLNASPDEYMVAFTPNATGAARLVGEAYPFSRRKRLVLLNDNHNSVNGIREFARRHGSKVEYVPSELPDLRVKEARLKKALRQRRIVSCFPKSWAARDSLFAFPAQSNFSGVQHPLEWIEMAQSRGYRVLLDAAAYLPTNPLDLSAVKPDFVMLSWYKIFGFPTGCGCLVMRKDAAKLLKRPWFSGGTIQAVSVGIPWHKMAPAEAEFEDGTLNFLSIPDVSTGLDWIESVGIRQIQHHVREVNRYCLEQMEQLRHSDGSRMILKYGPQSIEGRGGTISFNILDKRGRIVDERIVGREAARDNISLRTGCFCNPGVGEDVFELNVRKLYRLLWSKVPSIDEYISLLGLQSAGAIRVSFGVPTTTGDIDKLIDHLASTYKDGEFRSEGLPPRLAC